jgi:DNA-binding transcriptional regulator YhcF (GntR family)
MEFNSQKPIFLQICDYIMDNILTNKSTPGDRILSVRELATNISVNPNTISRAYNELQNQGIIEQQRGIGYFIADNAKELALHIRREEFTKVHFPILRHQMETLKITWQDLQEIEQSLTLKE